MIDNEIVYIGKSKYMLTRVAEHLAEICKYSGHEFEFDGTETKYKLLATAKDAEHRIGFDVIYTASSIDKAALENELGNMECEYIHKYHPKLNTQIPHEDDWRKYDNVKIDVDGILK